MRIAQRQEKFRKHTFVGLACNSPVEIARSDQAVLNSLHSFHMPSYFKDAEASAPLGTVYVKEKILNLEARLKGRAYKLALFDVLSDYFADYRHSKAALASLCLTSTAMAIRVCTRSLSAASQWTKPRLSVQSNSCVIVLQGKGYEDSPKAGEVPEAHIRRACLQLAG